MQGTHSVHESSVKPSDLDFRKISRNEARTCSRWSSPFHVTKNFDCQTTTALSNLPTYVSMPQSVPPGPATVFAVGYRTDTRSKIISWNMDRAASSVIARTKRPWNRTGESGSTVTPMINNN